MRRARWAAPWSGLLIAFMILSTVAHATDTDYARTLTSLSASGGVSNITNANDGDDGTFALYNGSGGCCVWRGRAATASSGGQLWIRFMGSASNTVNMEVAINANTVIYSATVSGAFDTGIVPTAVSPTIAVDDFVAFRYGTGETGTGVPGGTILKWYSVELYYERTGVQSVVGPRWAHVWVCVQGTDPCDETTAATDYGWSPTTGSAVIGWELDSGGCDVKFRGAFGSGYLLLKEDETAGGKGQHYVTGDETGYPLQAGNAYVLACTTGDPAIYATWPFSLHADGSVTGATGGGAQLPSGTDTTDDIGVAGVAPVLGAFTSLRDSFASRAPFVFIGPAVFGVTNTWANLQAELEPDATGRSGPIDCPGVELEMPVLGDGATHALDFRDLGSDPWDVPAHDTVTYSFPGVGEAWPDHHSFTILKCEDFETIVSGWSWWHQLRGLADYALYLGYGLLWLRRLQPRASVNG